ncbi:MAG TPA: GlsB/YeaQ/YmgE family stress response membrane protein [Trueperaceae bacterium]|jgi:uncharacterized membrane protein YeaQ/YmgE (transglycosylase-associated protein family)|nr:GlsB/YeaQ/YmgE family stress response membrane protein [Trueperaceae bacterium]HRQ10988.1 GlsB/YeaQ/YmgE family stress response membrane protein [Trueperaceae bacterium]
MSILLFIILGALAGWLAGAITGTGGGILTDIIVGIIGAFLGGWLFQEFGSAGITGFNFYSLLVAVVGAVILLVILKAVRR